MGALEFIASIIGSLAGLIGSLAWPALVGILLWFNRHRLANLSGWIKEVTFPGGPTIKFQEGVTALAETPEQVKLLQVQDAQAKDNIVDPLADLAKRERTLWAIAYTLRPPLLPVAKNPEGALAELVRRGSIDENTAQLFENLKKARDAALVVVQNNSPRANALRFSSAQALQFLDASKALNMKLREVSASLELDIGRWIPRY